MPVIQVAAKIDLEDFRRSRRLAPRPKPRGTKRSVLRKMSSGFSDLSEDPSRNGEALPGSFVCGESKRDWQSEIRFQQWRRSTFVSSSYKRKAVAPSRPVELSLLHASFVRECT
jgi:hypothetical protein